MRKAMLAFFGSTSCSSLRCLPRVSAQQARPPQREPTQKTSSSSASRTTAGTSRSRCLSIRPMAAGTRRRAQSDRGWSVSDITDPANTKVRNWLPGPANTRTVQVDIADGKMITGLERSQGGGDTDPTKPWDDGVLIWGLGDPVHPELAWSFIIPATLERHRNGYQGGCWHGSFRRREWLLRQYF